MAIRMGTCRKCHGKIELNEELRGVTWIERSRNFFYHKKCWEEFTDKDRIKSEDEWKDLLFDLITRELGSSYQYHMINAQLKKLKEAGRTMKGVYFCAYWYFVVKKREYKPEFGIGIIDHIYEEATEYWVAAEKKKSGILAEIEKIQAIEASHGRTIKVRRDRRKQTFTEPIPEPQAD